MFDKVWTYWPITPLAYGNKLLGNNRFLPDQCYHYTIIFPDCITNFLTLPNSTEKDTFFPDFPWPYKLQKSLVKSSASIYERLGSQLLRTTTGIQSRPDAFDESMFVMTFLTILGVMEILCSFRLVLEGKKGREIPESSRLEFLEKFSAKTQMPKTIPTGCWIEEK